MKYANFLTGLLVSFTLCHGSQSYASGYLGCGPSVRQQSIAGISNLKQQSDTFAGLYCHSSPDIQPGKDQWLPGKPQLRLLSGFPSTLSHSESQASLLTGQLLLPVWRRSSGALHIYLGGHYDKQQSHFKQAMLWTKTNQTFSAGQSVIIETKQINAGIVFDLSRHKNTINQLRILHSQRQQPIQVKQQLNGISSNILIPARLKFTQLSVHSTSLSRGWNFPWSFALGQGKSEDDGDGSFLRESGDANRFSYLKIAFEGGHRQRWSRSLHSYLALKVTRQMFDFGDNKSTDKIKVSDWNLSDTQFISAIEWRF